MKKILGLLLLFLGILWLVNYEYPLCAVSTEVLIIKIAVLLALALIYAALCNMAEERAKEIGRDSEIWWWIALILTPVFAALVLFVLDKREKI